FIRVTPAGTQEKPEDMDVIWGRCHSKSYTPSKKRMKQRVTLLAVLTVAAVLPATAQEIQPMWVQHHNGLVNVNASDKLPILVKAGATGDEAYVSESHGKIEKFANFLRYDDDHYLLSINENKIDEATETDPAKLDAATKCPDRSMVWI